MVKTTDKKSSNKQPVEKHDTAAWADVDKKQPVSNVAMPKEENMEHAKEWVDENEK